MSDRLRQLKKEMDDVRGEAGALQDQIEETERHADEHEAETYSTTKDCNRLLAQVREVESNCSKIFREIEATSSSAADLLAKVDDLELATDVAYNYYMRPLWLCYQKGGSPGDGHMVRAYGQKSAWLVLCEYLTATLSPDTYKDVMEDGWVLLEMGYEATTNK
jgi:chromosome segregation ATPase